MPRSFARIWRIGLLAGVLFSLGASGCGPQDAADGMSAEARKYLNEVLEIMQKRALHRDSIDWKRVREETLARAANAKTTTDTYVAIAHALSQLKERHSFLQLPDSLDKERKHAIWAEMQAELVKGRDPEVSRGKRSPFSATNEMDGHIDRRKGKVFAHVVVPHCYGQYAEWSRNTPYFEEFTKKLRAIVLDLLAQKPDGWIVDLRGNGGGNMWPMLGGIGIVVGPGDLGSFQYPGGSPSTWFYQDGKACQRDNGEVSVKSETPPPPAELAELPWVAVLIDRDTASSGEAVAISFAGRPRARSFGERTAGYSTANQDVPLSDGAMLRLCDAVEADRKGHRYEDGIDPDVMLPAPDSRPAEDADAVLQAGQDWISSQIEFYRRSPAQR
jgi:hypothetical protein